MREWSLPGIPHKGWECLEVVDLADECGANEDIEYAQCEMCGNEKIRYIHIMRHPDWPNELHVGCACAEKMTNDYVNPRVKETELRNRAARRTNFNKVAWRENLTKGTYSKKYKGEWITIMESRYGGYGVLFAGKQIWKIVGKKMRDFETAEKVAFDVFEEFHTTIDERKY